jgi:hypothetical protein
MRESCFKKATGRKLLATDSQFFCGVAPIQFGFFLAIEHSRGKSSGQMAQSYAGIGVRQPSTHLGGR